MPSSDDVRAQLTDILGQVVGCAPQDVVDDATLKDLGVDSLAAVETADELGRRFDVHIADEKVDSMVTVRDAVAAVVHHDGAVSPRMSSHPPARASPPAGTAAGAARSEPGHDAPPAPEIDPEQRSSAMRRIGFWFVTAGAVIGIVLGIGGSALVGATGIGDANLPPLAQPSTAAPTTPTATPTTAAAPSDDATPDPEPTLTIEDTQVAPGQRFALTGRFPTLEAGEELQVQVKDKGEAWDDFPVTTKARDDGEFKTQIYTSRTGERQFRMQHVGGDETTPAVTVQIG